MSGGGTDGAIGRWKDTVAGRVPDRRTRGNLAGIALVFAELVGRRADWKRALEGFEMTESEVVNEWIGQGEARGTLTTQRKNLLELLEGRFPGAVPGEVRQLIRQQESLPVLHDWFTAAVRAYTFEQFLAVVKT
ncbi:unnamed protein product [Gemmataceae bacterium]|nr:unnamed protein product [Gemmataceae bacterium]VTU00617.1 unnamed protein product [Gemmataceae bacterium]